MKSFKVYCHIVVRIFIDWSDCTYFDFLLSVVRIFYRMCANQDVTLKVLLYASRMCTVVRRDEAIYIF